MDKSKNDVFFVAPEKIRTIGKTHVTATEVIDGVKCIITLEKDREGHYHEVKLSTVAASPIAVMP